jgi:hypothetical protein
MALANPVSLSNGSIEARFGPRGLSAIAAPATGTTTTVERDEFALTLDGTRIDSATLDDPAMARTEHALTFTWQAGAVRIDVVYELAPGWHFLSKQIVVRSTPAAAFHVDDVTVFRLDVTEAVRELYVQKSERPALGTGDYAGSLRFGDGTALLALAQNPFLAVEPRERGVVVRYAPDMAWQAAWGEFAADRGLLVPVQLTGRREPARMLPEWHVGPLPAADGLDEAEVAAFTEAVRAFLLYRPERPLNLFVGWCVNDYQIDIATEEGRAEYTRVLGRAAELGAEHVLFAPTNSDLGRREDSVDDWMWENLLWLGLGQKIRRNEWDPRTGEMPATVQEMLDVARDRRLKLVAYVYPILAFSQNPDWLVTRPNQPDGKKYASLGYRSLQDWLIETLVAFHARTGISGYSFDHTFLGFDGPSRYAQWWGWRRVMEQLRRRIPDIVMDGRQAYHLYGPWGWLAGSFPHPTYSDEQPESFVPFPDLSFDRVSAARQRYTAYRFRNVDHAPSEIVPGFIAHQTARNDDTGRMPQTKTERGIMLDRFRPRDWDYLGWRYSLLSSIATAGWNNVLNMIPARDLEEYRHFSEDDKAWFRGWLEWTKTHREFLRHTRTILGQPAIGKVDGTSAIVGDRGFLFLFNPNARRLTARFTLDDAIGLKGTGTFFLRQLFDIEGLVIPKPGAGAWTYGDEVAIDMDGQSAMVIEIGPADALPAPTMFNLPATASVRIDGRVVRIDGARGEIGTERDVLVRLPAGQPVSSVRVNGIDLPFTRPGTDLVAVKVRFAGAPFRRAQQVGQLDAGFTGGTFSARFSVPARIFDQLAARQAAWPIPWTPEDFRTPWLAPHRLLLYVQAAEPDDRWEPRLLVDGKQVELRKAYTAIRAARRTFVGFYADVSLLAPDREYTLELHLPEMKAGQFQGVFFQNVEPEYTDAVVSPGR